MLFCECLVIAVKAAGTCSVEIPSFSNSVVIAPLKGFRLKINWLKSLPLHLAGWIHIVYLLCKDISYASERNPGLQQHRQHQHHGT